MELNLQFGHGMMGHARELIAAWGGGRVILSPRDLTEGQLVKVSKELVAVGGESLLDPQCFAHDADHKRLTNHDYWKVYREHQTAAFAGGIVAAELLHELSKLASKLGISTHIVPGLLATSISPEWLAFQEGILSEAPNHLKGRRLATIALSQSVLRDEAAIEELVERAGKWDVDGYYVVPETPAAYLVADPVWLANLLILTSGLKLSGREILVGYCSHQMLCLAAAGVDAIASGTWLNVRSFPPDKFYSPDEDEVSRRTTWYYCPQALSEYKLQFLDIALRAGLLHSMAPSASLGSTFADPLFAGANPTDINWGEQSAFRHYLTSLRAQAAVATLATFEESVKAHGQLLDNAEAFSRPLRSAGVRGGDRDFHEYFDVNRAAMSDFVRARGPLLSRVWR